jgi:hypothetical protein
VTQTYSGRVLAGYVVVVYGGVGLCEAAVDGRLFGWLALRWLSMALRSRVSVWVAVVCGWVRVRVRAVLFGCQGCSKLIECEDVGHAWSVDAADLLDSRVGAVLFDSGGWVVE